MFNMHIACIPEKLYVSHQIISPLKFKNLIIHFFFPFGHQIQRVELIKLLNLWNFIIIRLCDDSHYINF